MKELIIERLMKLLSVKSIVTIMLAATFIVLALRGIVSGDMFLTIFTVVISFYFGTQQQKDGASNG